MKKNKIFDLITDMAPYILLGIISMFVFLLFTKLEIINQPDKIQPIMIAAIAICLAAFLCITKVKGWKYKYLIALLLILGVVMRMGYAMYTHYLVRVHDAGFLREGSFGHVPYIWRLFYEHSLPNVNYDQWYHPPFYYLLCALAVDINSSFFPEATPDALMDAAKVVSCIASCSMLIIVRRLCKELSLKSSTTALVIGILALQPNLILMGGRVNNDAFVTFFISLIILYTVKWYNRHSIGNTIVLALAFGLGMMTKLSCGIMALFTGPVLLSVWIKKRKTQDFWDIFKKGLLFVCICFPLALWYPIRNLILFEQPLNYVPAFPTDSVLYLGDHTFAERFLSLPLGELFERAFCWPTKDYNIFLYIIRCSIFGEFYYKIPTYLTNTFLTVNLLLITCSLIATVYVLVKGKHLHTLLRFGMPLLWLIQMGSYFGFQLSHPYGCTMDYRYIAITAVIGALMIGGALSTLKDTHQKLHKFMAIPVVALVCLFGACTIVMYCQI